MNSSIGKVLVLGCCGKPGFRLFHAIFKEVSFIWKFAKKSLLRILKGEKYRESELLINFNALADITGVRREDLVGLDIQELEILWKRFFLLPETSSLSSNSIMQHILDEEKYAEALVSHEIDNIGKTIKKHYFIFLDILDIEFLEGVSSSSDNAETRMNDLVCFGHQGLACEAQSIRSEMDNYRDEEIPNVS
jgi:hypothetical protein